MLQTSMWKYSKKPIKKREKKNKTKKTTVYKMYQIHRAESVSNWSFTIFPICCQTPNQRVICCFNVFVEESDILWSITQNIQEDQEMISKSFFFSFLNLQSRRCCIMENHQAVNQPLWFPRKILLTWRGFPWFRTYLRCSSDYVITSSNK